MIRRLLARLGTLLDESGRREPSASPINNDTAGPSARIASPPPVGNFDQYPVVEGQAIVEKAYPPSAEDETCALAGGYGAMALPLNVAGAIEVQGDVRKISLNQVRYNDDEAKRLWELKKQQEEEFERHHKAKDPPGYKGI